MSTETVATWRVPCGIHKVHTEIEISEIEGSMPTLISRKELEKWGCNMFLAHDVLDYENLGLYNLLTTRSDGGHIAVDIFEFDLKKVRDDKSWRSSG